MTNLTRIYTNFDPEGQPDQSQPNFGPIRPDPKNGSGWVQIKFIKYIYRIEPKFEPFLRITVSM